MNAKHPKIDALMHRVLIQVEKRGQRAKLARLMGVCTGQIDKYLAGTRAPTGEGALTLLEWVSAQEKNAQSNEP